MEKKLWEKNKYFNTAYKNGVGMFLYYFECKIVYRDLEFNSD